MYGERPALVIDGDEITYANLNRAIDRVARAILAKRGPGSEPIAVMLEAGVGAIVALLAVLKVGKSYVPLDSGFPVARLASILQDSRAQLVIAEESTIPLLRALDQAQRDVLDINRVDSGGSDLPLELPIASVDNAYIMYTSGSTGDPKGVVQTHRNVLHKVMMHTNDYRICAEDRLSLLYSYSFSASVRCIFGALLNGAALVLFDVKRSDPAQIAERIINDKVTLYFSVPTLIRELAIALGRIEKRSRVRLIYLAGDTVSPRDVALYKQYFPDDCVLVHSLSANEAGTFRQYFISKETEIADDIVPVGFAVCDKQVMVLGEDHRQVGWNQAGEIAVRSRFLAPGYWARGNLTVAKFLHDSDDPEGRIYLTGDLGLMRPDGCLLYLGRKDSQVKIRGQGVNVRELEIALLATGAVKAAVVVDSQNPAGETRLIAYVVPVGQTTCTAATLHRALADKLPAFMVPSVFMFLDSLPLTPTGKIDRRALPNPGNGRPVLDNDYEAPRTRLESKLISIWSDILKIDPVGIHDDFFELGGHSLAATRVMSRVIDEFQLEIPLQSLFQSPTIADMAAVITEHQVKEMDEQGLKALLDELELMSDMDATRIASDLESKN